VAALAAAIVFFLLRKPPETPLGPRARPATKAPSSVDVTVLRQECEALSTAMFWRDLEHCSERLKPHDPALAATLRTQAEREAAMEEKYKALQKYIAEKKFETARVLVKRIEGSVYTDRAHKLLDEAEAQSKQP
jgi:hypothetical protein